MKKITLILTLTALIALTMSSCMFNRPLTRKDGIPRLNSPSVSIGEVEIQFDKTFPMPGLRKLPVKVFYYPVEDAVCLQWRMDMMTYYQFWPFDARFEFVNALEKYKADFEARAFGKSSRRTKRVYGKAQGFATWQRSRFSMENRGPNELQFGYYFEDRAPYFVVLQSETNYEDDMSRELNSSLPEVTSYFTRAQADELAALFDMEFISSVMSTSPAVIRDTESDFDDYYEE